MEKFRAFHEGESGYNGDFRCAPAFNFLLTVTEIFLSLLLAAHLLAMNVASAGPLAGAWLLHRGRTRRDGSDDFGRRLMGLSLAALVAGALLGGALCLAPSPALWAAFERFPADAYGYAAVELAFSAACLALLWKGPPAIVNRTAIVAGVALLSATNLLYHFPPLMAVIGELTADPRWTAEAVLDRATLRRLWGRPEILATWAHFTVASLAVAPLAAFWPCGARVSGSAAAPAIPAVRSAAVWSLAATALQLPVGIWLLVSTRTAARAAILGENAVASACFAAAMLAALMLLRTLLALALDGEARSVRRAGWLLVAVTVLMTATLRTSRIKPAPPTPPPSPVRLLDDAARSGDVKRSSTASAVLT